MTKALPPAVLYAAKSTADKKGSIPNQLNEGRDEALKEGRRVVAEFEDEKKSAYTGDRGDGLVAARAECERLVAEHGECALIIQHSDRLARGDGKQAAHLVEYALWAFKTGVRIVSIMDPETFAMEDLIYPVLMGRRNFEDSKRKSGATKAGLRERRAEGKWGGGPRPYGYLYDKEGEVLLRHPAEAPVVERIFAEYVNGRSFARIAARLEEDQVRPRKGRLWRSSTLRQIVTNPAYIGKMRHFEEVLEGSHEGFVDEEVWAKAQRLAAASVRKRKGRTPSARHILRGGKLKSECGSTMVCRSEGEGRYVCERVHTGLGGCSCERIPKPVIDSAVFAFFQQVGLDIDATRGQVAAARDRKLEEVRSLAAHAAKERGRAEASLARVRRDYTEGRITAADWSGFRDELGDELDAATAQVERLEGQLAEVEGWSDLRDAEQDTLSMLADIKAAIAGGTQDDESVDAVRAAILRLFDHFELHRIGPGERVHADLAWVGDLVIVPVVRPQAVDGFTSLQPIFRREPLYGAGNNRRDSHESSPFFGPIPIPVDGDGNLLATRL